jgi:molybdate transport system substrate-binding protein
VAVASNFAPVLEQLAEAFATQSGHHLVLITGATGQHYAQIINGAPFEVFLSADSERPAQLEAEGHGVAGSRFTYALGKLVLWSADPALVDVNGEILGNGNFRHLAIANPALAPFGLAAKQVLEARNLWEQLQSRIVQGENITQTLQFVQTGNAELGFIAYSQWLQLEAEQQGNVWQVPAELHAPIIQQGIILQDSAAARAFAAFIQNDSSRKHILAQGYELP